MVAIAAETVTVNFRRLPTCNVSLIMGFPLIVTGGAASLVLGLGVCGDFPEPGGRAVGMVWPPSAAVATRCRG